MTASPPPEPRGTARTLEPAVVMLAAAIAALAALVAYWLQAGTQVFGGLCAASLLLAGIGLVWWARWAMPDELATDEREELASSPEERAELAATFTRGSQEISRRRLLVGAVVTVTGAYAALAVSLLRSLAPEPEPILRHTAWQPSTRVVSAAGQPVKPDDLKVGGFMTVYPEAHVGDADAQTLLIRVKAGDLQLPAGRESWAVDGTIAYSKVCTHAGCPVGLFQEEESLLLCPCHQSTFDVLRGAVPTSGPAARPLPQLPLSVDADGYLVAQSDYDTPIGPGFWNITAGSGS
jgi:ubiquinol-cytochrome c reductase iron-sulfur subunit